VFIQRTFDAGHIQPSTLLTALSSKPALKGSHYSNTTQESRCSGWRPLERHTLLITRFSTATPIAVLPSQRHVHGSHGAHDYCPKNVRLATKNYGLDRYIGVHIPSVSHHHTHNAVPARCQAITGRAPIDR
jgi:hypothetical protein